MSGFITTMFVSSPRSYHPLFPAEPKPLQPIFTFAQSQSCMNLRLDMDVLDSQERGMAGDIWPDDGGIRIAMDLAKPKETYRSPLQRIGQALRIPQAGVNASSLALDPVPEADLSIQPGSGSPTRETPNYSYKLLLEGKTSPALDEPTNQAALGPGRDSDGFSHTGSIISPETRARMQMQQNRGYFGGTSLLSSLFSNPRTRAPFKPQKSNRGTSSWQLKQYAEATLGSGSLRKAVKLPEGEDKDEWLAVNVVDFYNQINLLYGSITEFCSPQSCPEMKATDEFEYLWQDSEAFKKPTKMPAPEYIEHLMAWVQSNVDNESMFPSRIGVPFPKTFPALIRNMFKRLYRVYAHIYCHHYPVIIELGLEPHLNTSFKHYVLFIDEHGLANGSKDFWGPLGDLVESMLRSD
ncbi:Mitotic exit network component [Neocucurbitaria cava]|uniref:Mitotic exit network component n=1 Tax=Neocucurbitaria cava TaxID=798079 RepID=A0A9W8Y5V0_9PLEO|nr:Mitotic exit network component [Neocucurbitaria cava]